MELLQSSEQKIRLQLTRQELVFINNILNEVCNGFYIAEFGARIGVDEKDANILLAEVHDLAKSMPKHDEV